MVQLALWYYWEWFGSGVGQRLGRTQRAGLRRARPPPPRIAHKTEPLFTPYGWAPRDSYRRVCERCRGRGLLVLVGKQHREALETRLDILGLQV